MRTFTDQQRFSHAVDHLLAAYGNPDFMLAKHRELGHEDVAVLEHEVEEQVLRMRLGFMYPLNADLPKIARRLMKKRTEVVQTLEWDLRQRNGRIVIDARGAPVQMIGHVVLRDGLEDCVADLTWEVHCGLPVVGSRIESILQDATVRMTAADQAVTQRLLQAA